MRAPSISWTEKMSVGVAALDDDHRKLLAILNDLQDGITAGQGTERLGRVLHALVQYIGSHFAHEEEMFAQSDYPHAAQHVQEHQALTRQVLDIQARYSQGQFDALSLETLDFLKDWLETHEQGSDRQYRAHLNAVGIH